MEKSKLIFTVSFIAFVLSGLSNIVLGQDAHFSQFYSAPLYLNPAYTGASLQNRVILNTRNQWPHVTGGMITSAASFDGYLPNSNSGIGVSIFNDYISSNGLRNTGLVANYAYHLPLSKTQRLSLGASAAVYQRSVDFFKFTFEDQLLTDGQVTPSAENRNAANGSIVYPDFSVGTAYYTKQWYIGLAAAHLNRPSQNNLKGLSNSERLPIRYTFNTGYKVRISAKKRNITDKVNETYLIPNALFKVQRDFHQMNLGISLQHNYFLAGIYHRSHPLSSEGNAGVYSQDALIFMVGAVIQDFTFGYSYDNHFNQMAGISNGSHEISLILNWRTYPKNKPKRYAPIPCPKI